MTPRFVYGPVEYPEADRRRRVELLEKLSRLQEHYFALTEPVCRELFEIEARAPLAPLIAIALREE